MNPAPLARPGGLKAATPALSKTLTAAIEWSSHDERLDGYLMTNQVSPDILRMLAQLPLNERQSIMRGTVAKQPTHPESWLQACIKRYHARQTAVPKLELPGPPSKTPRTGNTPLAVHDPTLPVEPQSKHTYYTNATTAGGCLDTHLGFECKNGVVGVSQDIKRCHRRDMGAGDAFCIGEQVGLHAGGVQTSGPVATSAVHQVATDNAVQHWHECVV
jgi:hypothetical protein